MTSQTKRRWLRSRCRPSSMNSAGAPGRVRRCARPTRGGSVLGAHHELRPGVGPHRRRVLRGLRRVPGAYGVPRRRRQRVVVERHGRLGWVGHERAYEGREDGAAAGPRRHRGRYPRTCGPRAGGDLREPVGDLGAHGSWRHPAAGDQAHCCAEAWPGREPPRWLYGLSGSNGIHRTSDEMCLTSTDVGARPSADNVSARSVPSLPKHHSADDSLDARRKQSAAAVPTRRCVTVTGPSPPIPSSSRTNRTPVTNSWNGNERTSRSRLRRRHRSSPPFARAHTTECSSSTVALTVRCASVTSSRHRAGGSHSNRATPAGSHFASAMGMSARSSTSWRRHWWAADGRPGRCRAVR